MEFWRKHWFDIGGGLAVVLGGWLIRHYQTLSTLQVILWLSLISLLLHQVEEYRWPGYFPGMINRAVYHSA